MSSRRDGAGVLDALPVLVLAVIAGAGSFTHIRDTAAEHGQRGPMSWAVAVCIDLTCVMAARERQRDKRLAVTARRVSWPAVVLAAGVVLSLAANVAQAQPTMWGRITAATPCAAFLVAVSLLERRASHPPAAAVLPRPDGPAPDGPAPDDSGDVPSWRGRPSPEAPCAPLLDAARRAAAEHHDTCGQPITRDALRARLGVSNQAASDLLRQIRTPERR